MSNLAVKEVEFNGDKLKAGQDKDTGTIYVGVRWVCEGIGLTSGQARRQVENLRDDIVLSRGVSNLRLENGEGSGSNQDVLCIELDFLPLWLAKIAITPSMKKKSPSTVENLVSYQIKAKDVLANAFIHNVPVVPKTYKESIEALLQSLEENEKLEQENSIMKPKAVTHDQLVSAENLSSMLVTAKNVGVGEKRLFEFLRATKVLFVKGKNSVPYQRYINSGYFEVKVSTWENKYGRVFSEYVTLVTGKGKPFINDLVNKYGGAEKIDGLPLREIKRYVKEFNAGLEEI